MTSRHLRHQPYRILKISTMVKLIDLTYYAHLEYNHPEQVMKRQHEALGFVTFIRPPMHLEVVKHLNFEGFTQHHGVQFSFFKKTNHFWSIPFKTHRYLKKQNPDVVLVQGLVFPLQVIFLRLALGGQRKIVVQHHGERPYPGLKSVFQKLADRCIDAYIFTAAGNATPWVQSGFISSWSKIHEVLEASTDMAIQNKEEARRKLGLEGAFNFLWVGRLNANKDPLTVLKAFSEYQHINRAARLFLIYQEQDLLAAVKRIIQSQGLEQVVNLVGKMPREDIASWYSAADYYISASHQEGSGYALLEAMACGCVPIVTDIAPFRKITGGGQYSLLFKPGDDAGLLTCLRSLAGVNQQQWSEAIRQHFTRNLSFKAIAENLSAMVVSLVSK